MEQKIAIIIGAGPAGLTAAYELLDKTDITPVIYEKTSDIGGISKTINYKGNRIDIGGHRFFSKSDRVMQWWQNLLPLQGAPSKDDIILKREIPLSKKATTTPIKSKQIKELIPPDPEKTDQAMLIRSRISRIYFLRKFFNYPIALNAATLSNLGVIRIFKIGTSYVKAQLFPIKEEKSLEDFFIKRFGKELYNTFFKDYTEKVWGVSCRQIKPEWGAQRIKGLSITKALLHAIKSLFKKDSSVDQKKTETSLIEQFTYPKFGPGQMWEKAAQIISDNGGELHMNHNVVGIKHNNYKIEAVEIKDEKTGQIITKKADYFFSTMPVRELIQAMGQTVPQPVREVAQELTYRDFITVGLLLEKLKIKNESKIKTVNNIIPDSWIYIQEREVKLGRLQIFNNWSPYMVKNPDHVWIGLEYFCNEGDSLWNKADQDFIQFAVAELASIDIIEKDAVLDSVVIRQPKTYPAYFGSYEHFDTIREYTDRFENLFLIGRNGMHRYNNQDHSMLTAMQAVENIITGNKSKNNIWSVNAEKEYHEEKSKRD